MPGLGSKGRIVLGAALVLAVVAVFILWRQRQDALAAQSALGSTLGAAGGISTHRAGKSDQPGDAEKRESIERSLR